MLTDRTTTTTGLLQPLHRAIRPIAQALLVMSCAAALTLPAGAEPKGCDEGVVCIHEERIDERIHLLAENRGEFPVTVTLRVKTSNMDPQGPDKVTHTLPAGKSTVAFELQPVDRSHRSRYRYYFDWTIGDQHAEHDDNHLYLLPYAPGRSYRVIQGFGSRFSHTGLEQYAIDFRMPEGTPVHAARSGVVAKTEERHSIGCWRDGCGRYANYVVILHDDGTTGEYYHLQKDGALVDVGERVEAGDLIALSGNTGHTTVPHLHFAVYRAVEWGNTQSVPVRFVSADGIIDPPRRGGRYQAIEQRPPAQRVASGRQTLNSDPGE